MYRKRSLAAALSGLMLMTALFTGCGSTGTTKSGDAGNGEVKMAKEQIIRHNIGAEPETLDPAIMTGISEGTIANAIFEGLTRYDKDAKIVPGIAEKWDISTDGLKYTFHLRDSKWSNGDPLTAADFEYAWKRALDPKTESEYAYQLYYIKGAEDYNTGKIKDASQVAVKAVDAKTLEVELRTAAPQFLGLTSFQTLLPLNKKTVEANANWWKDPKTLVTNGPFKVTAWNHRQTVDCVKNENYWDAKTVKLEKLVFNLVDSQQTALTLFETGQLDMGMNPPPQELDRLKQENKLVITPQLSTYFYRFNTTKKPFNDVRVRKALTLAIDRDAIVKNITKAGETPATAFIPNGIPDAEAGKDYRQVGGALFDYKLNVAEAKKLLAEAGYPNGKGFPTVSILHNNDEKHAKIAQAIQEMWKTNLGVNVKINSQEWQVYLDAEDNLDYDIARAGWVADYVDPMTFADMFVTGGGNNDTGWSSKAYDEAIKEANSTGDQAKRMEAMHKAEKILVDDMPIMPIYFYTQPYLFNPKLKDVVLPSFGYYGEFKWAWVAE